MDISYVTSAKRAQSIIFSASQHMFLQPKKSLGQHFLNSPSVLGKIISTANIADGETILEIGPGTGILTDELLKVCSRVISVEKDARAYLLLQQKYASEISSGKLELVQGDILTTDRKDLDLEGGKYVVVANIPYYITGAILESFLEYEPRPNRMILLVQKEVAERIVAKTKKESILSISVKAFGKARIVAKVPAGAFIPPPKVDSAILEISEIQKLSLFGETTDSVTIKKFFTIVKTAFAHKRKYALRNLEVVFDKDTLEKAWVETGLDQKARAEDISVEKWVKLSQILNS